MTDKQRFDLTGAAAPVLFSWFKLSCRRVVLVEPWLVRGSAPWPPHPFQHVAPEMPNGKWDMGQKRESMGRCWLVVWQNMKICYPSSARTSWCNKTRNPGTQAGARFGRFVTPVTRVTRQQRKGPDTGTELLHRTPPPTYLNPSLKFHKSAYFIYVTRVTNVTNWNPLWHKALQDSSLLHRCHTC